VNRFVNWFVKELGEAIAEEREFVG